MSSNTKSENCILICQWTRVAVNSARYSRFRTPLSVFAVKNSHYMFPKRGQTSLTCQSPFGGKKAKRSILRYSPVYFVLPSSCFLSPALCVRARMRVSLISPCHVTEGGEEQGGDYLRPLLLTSSFNLISLEISNFLTTHAHTHIYI